MRHERTLLNGDKIFLLFSYHVIHCNLANKPDRGLILNQFEDRGLGGGRGGGEGVLETGQVTLCNSIHFIKGITDPVKDTYSA